jgi:hypothetical protein
MNSKFKKVTRILGAFAILGAILACGGSSDDSSGNTTTTTTTGAQPTGETAPGVAAAQPGGGGAPMALAVGQPPATLQVPIPPSFNLEVATAGEYQIDVVGQGNDPRMFMYQGETLIEDDDDGGENNNARIVRFLTPGTPS